MIDANLESSICKYGYAVKSVLSLYPKSIKVITWVVAAVVGPKTSEIKYQSLVVELLNTFEILIHRR